MLLMVRTDDHDLRSVVVSQRPIETVLGLERSPGISHPNLNQREETRDSATKVNDPDKDALETLTPTVEGIGMGIRSQGELFVDGVEADTHEGEAGDEHPKDPHMFFLDSFPAETVKVGDKEDGGEDDNGPVLDAHPICFSVVGGIVVVGAVGVTAGDDADIGEGEEDEPYPHTPEFVVSHCLAIFVVVKRGWLSK